MTGHSTQFLIHFSQELECLDLALGICTAIPRDPWFVGYREGCRFELRAIVAGRVELAIVHTVRGPFVMVGDQAAGPTNVSGISGLWKSPARATANTTIVIAAPG